MLTAEEISRSRDKNWLKRQKKKMNKTALATKAALVVVTTKDSSISNERLSDEWDLEPTAIMTANDELQAAKVRTANAGWPWIEAPPQLLTQAPYALNEHNVESGFFTLPAAPQSSPMLNMQGDVVHPILSMVFERHGCASKFGATCQAAFNMVAAYIDHWDVSRSNFNLCDWEHRRTYGQPAFVGKAVVVTPFRVRNPTHNYMCNMSALQGMTQAFSNFANCFQILHLHRVPLLTTEVLALVVPHMRNLKVLGVYRCELIHLGHTMRLLEILQQGRERGEDENVSLDFYPRFHVGPEPCSANNGSQRAYGVTWDNFRLDSRLAIWQLMSKILPQARNQGVDLVGKGSAMLFWLESSPCSMVSDTIDAILSEKNMANLATQLDFPHTKGSKSKLSHGGGGCVQHYLCAVCNESVLGIFFDYNEWFLHTHLYKQTGTYVMTCLGCKLRKHLNGEPDHSKIQKQSLVNHWLRNPDGTVNEDNVQRALGINSKRRGMRYARKFHNMQTQLTSGCTGAEQQAPIPRGEKFFSPTIYDKEHRHSFW